jgi:glycosyltransferase involved in cell wall biosynthesis
MSGTASSALPGPQPDGDLHGRAPSVSVVIPCLDEAATIGECVRGALQTLRAEGLAGEVIVVDNGSGDGSGELAAAAGARVVRESRRGYGSAYLAGLAAATGDHIIMVDADLTYDVAEIPRFVHALEAGADLVMGNRMGGIEPGAMSLLSRLGNPLLSRFLNLLYHTGVRDVHCGMRALRRDVLARLDLRTTGMEFASEMVIRAARQGLIVRELPIRLHPRRGDSKLAPLRDGWRHLRLMLIYSPSFLFLLPGALLVFCGLVLMALVLGGVPLFGRPLHEHTLIGGSMLAVVGTQVIGLGLCGRTYAYYHLNERDLWLERMRRRLRLEHGLLAGTAITLAGLGMGTYIVASWISRGFGTLADQRLAILATTTSIIGIQVVFTSFLLSLLGLHRRDN